MQNIPPNRATRQQPAASTPTLSPPAMRPLRRPVNALRPSSSSSSSARSSPPPEQVNAFLAPVWRGDESDNKRITTRSVTKRRSEANDPADGTGDKKAKAAAQSQAGPVAVKQEADGDLATRAAPHTSARIPEPMEDPVDALLTLGLRARVEPPVAPVLPAPLAMTQPPPAATDMPPLEADPVARAADSKTSAAFDVTAYLQGVLAAQNRARELGETCVMAMDPRIKPATVEDFLQSSRQTPLRHPLNGTMDAAAFVLTRSRLQALAHCMTPEQRQAALREAKNPLLPQDADQGHEELLRRRAMFIALYAQMSRTERDAEFASIERETDLPAQGQADARWIRLQQAAAHSFLSTDAQRVATLTELRQPGHLLGLEGAGLARAIELRTDLLRGVLYQLPSAHLPPQLVQALTLTPDTQGRDAAEWSKIFELRCSQLQAFTDSMYHRSVYPSVLQAVLDPAPMMALSSGTQGRSGLLREKVVHQLFKRMTPAEREQEFNAARSPDTLLTHSDRSLHFVVMLRRAMFKAYFRHLSADAARTAARDQLALALSYKEMAYQPDALAAREGMLRLAMVEATRPWNTPAPSSSVSRPATIPGLPHPL